MTYELTARTKNGKNLEGGTCEAKKMTHEELNAVLERHKHWLEQDCEGWEAMRADIRGADLSGADLRGASLLQADIRGADLSGADIRGADLSGADLSGADLSGADLIGAKNIPFIPMACPDAGAFVGWKKCCNNVIVKLRIPEDARRSSSTGRKCRCDKAEVIGFESIKGEPLDIPYAVSKYDCRFWYRDGFTVSVTDFGEDRFEECAPGIHFFINRQEAVDYN